MLCRWCQPGTLVAVSLDDLQLVDHDDGRRVGG
jgi:hypothetical protein